MSSSRFSNQAGLEVVPDGGGIPHVVEGPTILGKPADGAAYNQQGVFHQNASPSSAYPPSNYLAQSQGYMRSSHDGTYVTDKFPASSVPPTGERVLGLKRKTFWLIFGPLIALLVIGLAVGLGVGLGTSHHDSSTSSG
ncbi:hypothetical protein M426DRAFT_103137 [Hypoxylon sp. CI-4A]|nr:hypothetical protein M426DRAFT_103137 [Hypoxylon sp. CI-4A]